MKVKAIRSGDKNFEEKKAKMFEPKTLSKEDQLRIVFRTIIEKSFDDDYIFRPYKNRFPFDKLIKRLICEVKIRTKL